MRPGLAATLAAAALAGCALQTPPAHPAVVASALPPATSVPPAWKQAANDGAVADGWVAALGDPALALLVTEALANNRDLAAAAQRVVVAQQRVIVAGAQLLPQVGAAIGGRTTRDEGHDSAFNGSIAYGGVSWEIDLWGRLRAQQAAAAALADASALEWQFARQSLAATVARAWVLACEARQLLALSRQAVEIYTGLLRLVRVRRNAGRDTDLDIADILAKLDASQGAVLAALAAYGEAQRALEVLLGRYPASELEVPQAYLALPAAPAPGTPGALLLRRPDIVAAERQVLAAFRGEQAARLALLPGVSVSLLGGRVGDTLLSTLQLNPWLATAAIGVSIPIYEGGALRARVAIATAQQAAAVAHYGSVVLLAFREVENALADERLIAARIPFGEGSVTATTDAVRLARLQYEAGKRDLLWVSNLQSQQLGSQTQLVQLRGQQRINRIGLLLAIGARPDSSAARASAPITPGDPTPARAP